MQVTEIDNALAELEKTKEDVYKAAGPILIKSSKADVKKDLSEKKEIIDVRVKTLEKGEEKLKKQFEDLKEKISKTST